MECSFPLSGLYKITSDPYNTTPKWFIPITEAHVPFFHMMDAPIGMAPTFTHFTLSGGLTGVTESAPDPQSHQRPVVSIRGLARYTTYRLTRVIFK